MKPRGALESFATLAALSGLAFGLGWKVLTGSPAESSTVLGLAFGAIVSALSVGKLTEVKTQVPVANRDLFLGSLQAKLAEQGLFAKAELPTYRLFESVPEGTFSIGPLSLSGWVNRVRVSLGEQGATVVGPQSVLTALGLPLP